MMALARHAAVTIPGMMLGASRRVRGLAAVVAAVDEAAGQQRENHEEKQGGGDLHGSRIPWRRTELTLTARPSPRTAQRLRFAVAIMLLVSLPPGMFEVIETVVHVAVDADLAAHEDSDDARGCSEHTCTPLAHHCGCHATMSAQVTARVSNAHALRVMTELEPNAIVSVFERNGEPPPLRPPIV